LEHHYVFFTIVITTLLLLATAAHAQTNKTSATNPLKKAASLADQVANYLKKIAYAIIVIAAFVGVINYAFGRGPEWLGRAVMAAIAISVVLWIIGQFIA